MGNWCSNCTESRKQGNNNGNNDSAAADKRAAPSRRDSNQVAGAEGGIGITAGAVVLNEQGEESERQKLLLGESSGDSGDDPVLNQDDVEVDNTDLIANSNEKEVKEHDFVDTESEPDHSQPNSSARDPQQQAHSQAARSSSEEEEEEAIETAG